MSSRGVTSCDDCNIETEDFVLWPDITYRCIECTESLLEVEHEAPDEDDQELRLAKLETQMAVLLGERSLASIQKSLNTLHQKVDNQRAPRPKPTGDRGRHPEVG